MDARLENRMVIDAEWESTERPIKNSTLERLPTCECCGERIIQEKALHIRGCFIWICDGCIEDGKEPTVLYED